MKQPSCSIMATKSTLFSDDSDIEDYVPSACGDEIHINKNYANYYESFRKKEELQKLKDKQSQLKSYDSSSGDSSFESLDDELIKPTAQAFDFLANSLLALENGSAKNEFLSRRHYSKNDKPEKEGAREKYYFGNPSKKKKRKEAVYTMDTHRRETNWSTGEGGELSDDEKEPHFPERRIGPGLCLQHRAFDDLLADKGVFSDEDSQKDSKKNTQSPGQSSGEDLNDRLKQALYRPNMTEQEQFLANYIFKQKQQLEEQSDSEDELRRHGNSRRQHYAGGGDMHGFVYEDEAEETRRTMRETLASFGGAGPSLDQQRPKSYPAVLESTVRIKDDKRRQRRLKDAERKAAEKQRLRQQVQQLQAIKRKEIQDRLKKIQEISGQARLAFNEDDLDDEFDPDAHDRKMQEAFGENYYVDGADNKKPVFQYDEGIDNDTGDYDGYRVHAGDEEDEDDAEVSSSSKHGKHNPELGEYPEEHDADAPAPAEDGEVGGSSRRRRGKRRRNDQLSLALQRKKPLFDSEQHDFDKYFDEYYALNFEDIIAGGEVKCRFRYKQVEPNNFGLSTEEILVADDKELNRWCSLKKILKIDRTKELEERDRKVYKAKGQNIAYKKKMLSTLFKPPEEEVDTETVIDVAATQRAEEDKKKKKNLKKKLRKQLKFEEEEKKKEKNYMSNSEDEKEDSNLDPTARKSTTSKSNKRKRDAVDDDEQESINEQEKQKDEQPKAKKLVHTSTTVLKAKKSKADDLHKFNKKMKKRRCEEEAKLQSEGLVPKQKESQRKSRKDLVVGDAFSTVLKLSDERLAAYNIAGLSKIKKQARYQEKMAERGQLPGFKKNGKGEKSYGKHTKEKRKKHDKSAVNNKKITGGGEASRSKNKNEKSKEKKEKT